MPEGNEADQLELVFPTQPLPADTWAGVDQAAENTDDHWRSCVEQAIAQLARSGRPWTTDQLRELLPPVDEPNRIGAAIRRAYKAGVIVPTGNAKPSTTTSRKGGLLREWRGAA